MTNSFLLALKDSDGINWGVWVLHDGDNKQLYTRQVDIEGVRQATINSFGGSFKIKVSTSGQILSYPLDDLG